MDTTLQIQNAISEKITEFLAQHNLTSTDTLVSAQKAELADSIAEVLDTVNPTGGPYPSTGR